MLRYSRLILSNWRIIDCVRCGTRGDCSIDTLKEIVQREVSAYTGKGLNGYSYLVANPDQLAFTVVTVGYIDGERFATADLIVRIIGNYVVIERDDNDPP